MFRVRVRARVRVNLSSTMHSLEPLPLPISPPIRVRVRDRDRVWFIDHVTSSFMLPAAVTESPRKKPPLVLSTVKQGADGRAPAIPESRSVSRTSGSLVSCVVGLALVLVGV